jgi:hypothetical protein
LKPILRALVYFMKALELLRTKLGTIFAYPLIELFKIRWTSQHGSFSFCCFVNVCVITNEVV